MANTTHDSDRFMLRLPDGMRDRVKIIAEQNGRSMNAEMLNTLEKTYPREIIEKDLHSRTIAELQNCKDAAAIRRVLKEANEMAARNGFAFHYDFEITSDNPKEKTVFITIKDS